MEKKKVLIGSPIHQKSNILQEFLISLEELQKNSFSIDYLFMDDNSDEESCHLLQVFQQKHQNVEIVKLQNAADYHRDEYTHYWSDVLIWKVAAMKDSIIHYAKEHNYDYLFLVDSDLVLHPHTLEQLIKADKNIITNIFWTRWQPNTIEMPQVWVQDEYTMYTKNRSNPLSDEEATRQTFEFMAHLRVPGVYKVGGLGACTLISLKAIQAGVRFEKINNLSFWGEDRHFCIRAAALGFSLNVDTHYPAFHIYRESDLDGVSAYKQNSR
jgi:GT2 family glycosyltransferase